MAVSITRRQGDSRAAQRSGAIPLAMSGLDILVMRHPESAALVKRAIEGLVKQ